MLANSEPQQTVSEISNFDYAEYLADCHEKIQWLRSLFLAIQADEDVEEGFQVHCLASVGEHLAQDWINDLALRRIVFN